MHPANVEPAEPPDDRVGKNMEHLFAANARWANEMKQQDPVNVVCAAGVSMLLD